MRREIWGIFSNKKTLKKKPQKWPFQRPCQNSFLVFTLLLHSRNLSWQELRLPTLKQEELDFHLPLLHGCPSEESYSYSLLISLGSLLCKRKALPVSSYAAEEDMNVKRSVFTRLQFQLLTLAVVWDSTQVLTSRRGGRTAISVLNKN